MEYVTPSKAARILKVVPTTLAIWNQKGQIKAVRTKGGHRRYLLSDLFAFTKEKNEEETVLDGVGADKKLNPGLPNRKKYCYARVSSSGQKDDLQRQIDFFRTTFPDHNCVSDIGSGLNFKRKAFCSLLDEAERGNVSEIVVTHKDRLCRFGFELIERTVRRNNGKIVVLDKEETSPEKELVNDLLSIVTVFSGRLYGLRSSSIRNAIKNSKNQTLPDEGTEIGATTLCLR